MKYRIQAAARWIAKFIQSPVVIIVTFLFSLTSFGFALKANATATSEANHRAQISQEAANHLRVTVCGILEPYANAPGTPATEAGKKLKESFIIAKGPQGADCTPDPNDGK